MKKLLLILLLAILPLQVSWAAVAVYCQHEEEVTSQHFGHHEHEHEVAQADEESKEGSIELHADCVTCHGLAAAMLMPAAEASPFAPSAKVYIVSTSQLASVPPSPPEKPNWVLAA